MGAATDAMTGLDAHYRKYWGEPAKHVFAGAPGAVISVSPHSQCWTYATRYSTSNRDGSALSLAFHLHAPTQDDRLAILVAAIWDYHRTGPGLDRGHTIYWGEPWLPGSKASHSLVSLPYLFGPELERTDTEGERCYWVIPIMEAERDYRREHGTEALEALFEERGLDYLDPQRESVVATERT